MVPIRLPEPTRKFPSMIQFLLPLRNSFAYYKADSGRVLVPSEAPETSVNDSDSPSMTTMMCQVSIVGHASIVNNHLCVCEALIEHVNPDVMCSILRKVYESPLKWVTTFGNTTMTPHHASYLSKTSIPHISRPTLKPAKSTMRNAWTLLSVSRRVSLACLLQVLNGITSRPGR